jgi:2-polyprenyl-3-methyl-5-hydroxy-6-metoxy-1,4-benzoquinol methylase
LNGQSTTAFRCLVCESKDAPALVEAHVTGDATGRLRAVRCAACAHVQLSPSSYDLELYHEDGQVKFVVEHYGTPIETLFEHSAIEARRRAARFAQHGETLRRSGRDRISLLDVGGGYGFFASAMSALHPGVETRLLEPSRARVETGKRYFQERGDPGFPAPDCEVGLLDEAFVQRHRAQFDIVTLWHVLEHVDDPRALLRRAGEILRPGGGGLWVEVPNLEDELSGLSSAYRKRTFMREHVSYFSASILEEMALQLFPGASVEVHGYQRYGIFNYFHWIHFNAAQGASPDMFEKDRWWLEENWRRTRESSRTSDALLMIIRPNEREHAA